MHAMLMQSLTQLSHAHTSALYFDSFSFLSSFRYLARSLSLPGFCCFLCAFLCPLLCSF
eukprot:m.502996 g.502996  ORF g.502996 m.502996 type:complete len:59 (-) comp69832_c0_seq1:132-308(-)